MGNKIDAVQVEIIVPSDTLHEAMMALQNAENPRAFISSTLMTREQVARLFGGDDDGE